MRKHKGFTLLELLIVTVVIVTVTTIAIPGVMRARMISNETSAIASLRSFIPAQISFKNGKHIDQDSDGLGEFGSLNELSGQSRIRNLYSNGGLLSTKDRVSPGYISPNFRASFLVLPGFPASIRSGYVHVIYVWTSLVDRTSADPPLTLSPTLHASLIDGQENSWIAYAWPQSLNQSGVRVFAVHSDGTIAFAENKVRKYSGGNRPTYSAACEVGGPMLSFPPIAMGNINSMDGEKWFPVGN